MAYGYGFIPIGGMDGRPYNGGTRRCVVLSADTTDIYPGDFVKYSGDGNTDGVMAVTKVAAGEVILGAVVSVEPNQATDLPYVLGSVAADRFVQVAVATPGMLFKCATSAALAVTDIGKMCPIVVNAGAAPYWTSKSTLNKGTLSTTAEQLNIMGTVQNGKAPTAADADVVVRVALPQIGLATASVGV